jgi:hypothetical protein
MAAGASIAFSSNNLCMLDLFSATVPLPVGEAEEKEQKLTGRRY